MKKIYKILDGRQSQKNVNYFPVPVTEIHHINGSDVSQTPHRCVNIRSSIEYHNTITKATSG